MKDGIYHQFPKSFLKKWWIGSHVFETELKRGKRKSYQFGNIRKNDQNQKKTRWDFLCKGNSWWRQQHKDLSTDYAARDRHLLLWKRRWKFKFGVTRKEHGAQVLDKHHKNKGVWKVDICKARHQHLQCYPKERGPQKNAAEPEARCYCGSARSP